MYFLLVVALLSIDAIGAFNPSFVALVKPVKGATHEEITRCGLATVTSEYFQSRFGITIDVPTITNGTCPPSLFSQIQSAFSKSKYQGGSTYSRWSNTVDDIVDSNELVDLLEQTDASRHFDSESFVAGSSIIRTRYQSSVTALYAFDYDKANDYFGQMTHTLQDFYSHSNWIELNNRQPQTDLGINVLNTSQFAGPTARTCTSCSTGADNVCYGNNDISKGLTSGYFSIGVDIFNRKRTGKCSHGGSADATRDNDAIGGINKDARDSIHGYLHTPAAQTAYLATCKILQQLCTQVGNVLFGKFLNVLSRQMPFSRSVYAKVDRDPRLLYTNIFANLRQAESFSLLRQVASVPAVDSFYKAHILALARRKHISIDIFRSSIVRQDRLEFGQDLAQLTGGLFIDYSRDSTTNIKTDIQERTELIEFFDERQLSDKLIITVDQTCTDLLLDLNMNDADPSVTIKLQRSNQRVTPSAILIDTTFYKSYRFTNLSKGQWEVIVVSSSIDLTFDLRVSCASQFRCFSHLYTENDNAVHTGHAELNGNLITNHHAQLRTSCDNNRIPLNNLSVSMVDASTGVTLVNSLQSIYDSNNNQWATLLHDIPSTSFRLRFSINNGDIQRLSRSLYQPSLIDVQIYQIETNARQNSLIKYQLVNYHPQPVNITLLAKNIGTFIVVREYKLEANSTYDDQIEIQQNARTASITGDTVALTVTSNLKDWNYDVVSL